LKTQTKTQLKRHLKKTQGHLGRGGDEIKRLAAATGVSVHMLQSVAMGRRKFCDETDAVVRSAMETR
jgi:hypothetical protein